MLCIYFHFYTSYNIPNINGRQLYNSIITMCYCSSCHSNGSGGSGSGSSSSFPGMLTIQIKQVDVFPYLKPGACVCYYNI